MMPVIDVTVWLAGLRPDSSIGVDKGGLTLREVTKEESLTDAQLEIGGLPEELEP